MLRRNMPLMSSPPLTPIPCLIATRASAVGGRGREEGFSEGRKERSFSLKILRSKFRSSIVSSSSRTLQVPSVWYHIVTTSSQCRSAILRRGFAHSRAVVRLTVCSSNGWEAELFLCISVSLSPPPPISCCSSSATGRGSNSLLRAWVVLIMWLISLSASTVFAREIATSARCIRDSWEVGGWELILKTYAPPCTVGTDLALSIDLSLFTSRGEVFLALSGLIIHGERISRNSFESFRGL
mmetsp:Transcript_33344/g.74751  ORF Transcript_33344/g.74751 Transcript_33344/m.74751 type:complete len:240 (-) Transcript_33344:807-1526(-)